MKRLFLLAGVLMLTGGLSTMNAEVIYVTENGVSVTAQPYPNTPAT